MPYRFHVLKAARDVPYSEGLEKRSATPLLFATRLNPPAAVVPGIGSTAAWCMNMASPLAAVGLLVERADVVTKSHLWPMADDVADGRWPMLSPEA
eukprot:6422015-Prymnesium_polylepis.1